MFIVQDQTVAALICIFYENPNDIGVRDELVRLGLLDTVEQYVQTVKALTIEDFIKNDRWVGISPELDKYIPTFYCTRIKYPEDTNSTSTSLQRTDIIRAVSIQTESAFTYAELRANDSVWLKEQTTGVTELSINVKPGLPTCLTWFNDITANTDARHIKVITTNTMLPVHILNSLKSQRRVIVPIKSKDWYLHDGFMEDKITDSS